MSNAPRWSDLSVRILSALVLLAAAIGAVAAGPIGFTVFIAVVSGCMTWELVRMHAPRADIISIAAGVAMASVFLFLDPIVLNFGWGGALGLFLALPVVFALLVQRDRFLFPIFWLAIFIAGLVALLLFNDPFFDLLLLMIAVVIVTDVFGYFAGRFFGGAKFWPSISPKKTWSGVVAGWAAAACVGTFAFFLIPSEGALVIPFAVLMSFASQMGDIAESTIKRRAGYKDSSGLIPGHGGFLDRFDGIIGASLVVFLGMFFGITA